MIAAALPYLLLAISALLSVGCIAAHETAVSRARDRKDQP